MNLQLYNRISVPFVLVLVMSGCADQREDVPPPTASGVQVHETGWADPASDKFHGNSIRANNWDMRSCQACHGSTYAGGIANSSCRDCHTGGAGPENCATCHGGNNPAPPRDLSGSTLRSSRGVGAHQVHLNGSAIASGMFCSTCHNVPPSMYAPGHVDSPQPAEIIMGSAVANTVTNEPGTPDHDIGNPVVTPSPAFSTGTLGCSNTYCHGYFKNGNFANAPVWNDTTSTAAQCGTCHGDVTQPPNTLAWAVPRTTAQGGTHPDVVSQVTPCNICHGDVVDANYRIINTAKHINGKLNVFGEERDY